MIISAGKSEEFKFAYPIGVGLIDSAINLTRLCLFDKPEYLIFIGSAGSYGKYNTFDIVESTIGSNIELSFLSDDSYSPIDNVVKINNVNNEESKEVIVNSSNYISTNAKLSKNFLDYKIDLENMEFYSVCKVAQEFDIPVKGIFVVTNNTDKNAHDDFIKNHDEAMAKLVEYLTQKKLIVPRGTNG